MFVWNRPPLMDREDGSGGTGAGAGIRPGASGGLDPALSAAINETINNAIAGIVKRDLPNIIKTQMGSALDGFRETFTQQFLDQLSESLPSDEEIAQMEADAAAGGAGAGGDGQPAGGEGGEPRIDPRINAQLLDYQKQNKTLAERISALEQEREEALYAAEDADRRAQIQGALNKFPFAGDFEREVAFDYFLSRAQRQEDGSLVLGDLPVTQAIEESMGKLGGLLQTKPVSGAGATNSGKVAAAVPTMDMIRPGASKETLDAVRSHTAQQLSAALQGQH